MARPRLKLPLSPRERFVWGAVITTWLYGIWSARGYSPLLPDRIPMKFGWEGEPISWASRESIWFLPVLGTFLVVVFAGLAYFPHVHNIPWKVTDENRADFYRLSRELLAWTALGILVLFVWVNSEVAQVALGQKTGLSPWFLPILLALSVGPLVFYWREGRRIALTKRQP